MRNKTSSQKQACQKERCCGASNERENFLSVTSRGHSHSQSKKKGKKIKKKQSVIKDLLKETCESLKQQNQELKKKLQIQKKKVSDYKQKLADYETEIHRFQQLEKKWLEGHNSADKRKKSNRSSEDEKNYTKIIQDSHHVAKQTLGKYKRLEEEYSKYKQNAEKKIDKLRQERQKLISEGAQKNHNHQIEELKEELNRFKQDQITMSSLKNLHQNQNNLVGQEQKMKVQISSLKVSVSTLKSENSSLKDYVRELEEELEERRDSSQNKERQLKRNLDVINDKINNWQRDYKLVKQECQNWEKEYNMIFDKYQRKKNKYRMNNAQWAEIFKQFIIEIDKLKQELDYVSERNMKLIKLYGQ